MRGIRGQVEISDPTADHRKWSADAATFGSAAVTGVGGIVLGAEFATDPFIGPLTASLPGAHLVRTAKRKVTN